MACWTRCKCVGLRRSTVVLNLDILIDAVGTSSIFQQDSWLILIIFNVVHICIDVVCICLHFDAVLADEYVGAWIWVIKHFWGCFWFWVSQDDSLRSLVTVPEECSLRRNQVYQRQVFLHRSDLQFQARRGHAGNVGQAGLKPQFSWCASKLDRGKVRGTA